MYMVDAEAQEKQEELREQNPIEHPELDENASVEEQMKARLSEILHKDPQNENDSAELLLLLDILKDDDDPFDDNFKGQHGNYIVGDGFVGSNSVFTEGPNDSEANINGCLELSAMAKAAFGDLEVHGPAGTEEQLAMHSYAANLAGVNAIGMDHSSLSPEIMEKMDNAWAKMNGEEPAPSVELAQDMTAGLTSNSMSLGSP